MEANKCKGPEALVGLGTALVEASLVEVWLGIGSGRE